MLRSALPPGLRASFAASALSRLSAGALGLIFVLLTHERTGSFAAGGAVAAACALGFAVGAPVLGRLVDRRGQGAVLVGASVLHASGLALVALMPADGPLAVALLGAWISGVGYPPVSSALRAVWNTRLDPGRRHAAYALDAVLGEVMYIAGPLLLVGAIGAWSFEAAALVAAVLTVAGTIVYTRTQLVREWDPAETGLAAAAVAGAAPPRDRLGALRSRGLCALLASAVLFGVAVAAMELGVAAFSEEEGVKGATGVILAFWGLGSLLGGLWATRHPPGDEPARAVALGFAFIAVTTVPLAFAPNLFVLGALIVPCGFCIAPVLTLVFGLAADVTPEGTVTEANTWISTGVGAGMALGGAVAGQLVESVSPAAGFLLAAAFMLFTAMIIAAMRADLSIAPAARGREILAT